MARPRMLRIGAIAVILLLATIAALAIGLVIVDERAGTASTCSVVAFAAQDDPRAVDLPATLLEEHPEILDALAKVDPPSGGVAALDCGRLAKIRADIEALGAPPSASGDYLVRHEGAAYALSVTLAVA